MIVPGSAHALLLSTSGYTIPYSLRFRAANSAYLERTPASASNRKTWTWSAWVKRGTLGGAVSMNLFVGNRAGTTDSTYTDIVFTPSNQFAFRGYATNWRITTAVFRDTSAWYHLVVALDTTQATADDRVKIYVNGTQITAFGTSNNPALNADLGVNTAQPQSIGRDVSGGGTFFDGYMSEINFVDGQQLSPSSFGQTDSATGVWVPKKYSGTYGTNGFYLKFADASAATATAIGKDSSGNGNNWTPSGISVTSGVTFDQMTDTPTLNYPVWSVLDKASTVTLSDANLKASGTTINSLCRSSIAMPLSGKWYMEFVPDANGLDDIIGVATAVASMGEHLGFNASGWGFQPNISSTVYKYNGSGTGTAVTGTAFSSGDVGMLAIDVDSSKIWLGRNGTWYESGNPATGANAQFTNLSTTLQLFFAITPGRSGSGETTANFGQRAFSYTPPTGFKALNTANLPTPSIKKGSLYMDATLRTGTGATASVSSLGFQPDWVWIKSRSNGTAHNLFNSVIGATKGIQTTGPNAQYTDANSLTAFNANGYSLGSDASSRGVNINTNTYVDWAWKESTTAGLDILSWTGDGTGARTINHGLGVTPEFMMLRGTDARAWACWFNSMTSAAYYMDLGTSNGQILDTTMFDSTAPTSTTFRVGSYNNVNAVAYVGYFFSSIAGFSQIGSYTGNASTDGPFVWCGFRPKFVMVKAVDIATTWIMANPSNSGNEVIRFVYADYVNAETSNTYGLDLLSNGFKVRAPTGYSLNNSGNKYAFIAFAENPFKYARAR